MKLIFDELCEFGQQFFLKTTEAKNTLNNISINPSTKYESGDSPIKISPESLQEAILTILKDS
jgi:hypothetical protein